MLSCARRFSCSPVPAEGVVAKEDDGIGFTSCCACRSLWVFLSVTVFFVDGMMDLEEIIRRNVTGRLLNYMCFSQMNNSDKKSSFVRVPLLLYVQW